MSDHLVACMQDGDLKSLRLHIDSFEQSINQYVYCDEENNLNLLHLAVGVGSDYRDEVVELLIEMRADVNFPGRHEGTDNVRAIHIAAMWGYDTTLKLLLYHGADASLRTSGSRNYSPLDYASVFDNYVCISLLIRYGSLNSTATAWSAIMDQSLGDSERETTIGDLYMTALDFGNKGGGDEGCQSICPSVFFDDDFISSATTTPTTATMASSKDKKKNNINGNDSNNNNHSDDDDKDDDIEDDDDDDPLALITDEEIDLNMDNLRLRGELRKLGRNPGPITQTTKRLYAKLLARLIKEDKELVYSSRTTAKFHPKYSHELNSLLTGNFYAKQALELEKEFVLLSGTRNYHGPKQFFNYILIDPRKSCNLPEQAVEASDSDTSRNQSRSPEEMERRKHAMRKVNRRFNPKLFGKFIESIFYIGKGQKKRDFIHLYDALADRGSITHQKIEKIRDIWSDGFGVVSLHLFHNITSKEALTREALMIETIGLDNLTNLIKGTIQLKLGWNEHKRRLLGALLLHRAYNQLLNEGERQLRREDLKF